MAGKALRCIHFIAATCKFLSLLNLNIPARGAFIPHPILQRPSSWSSHPHPLWSTVSSEDDDELQRRYNNEDGLGDVPIPTTGISVSDEMEARERDRFETELVPMEGFAKVAAQLITTVTARGSFEPTRYLLSLSKRPVESTAGEPSEFAMIDVPPFSPGLVAKMKAFMGENSRLAAVLVTSRDAIHYDDAPAVYRLRRAYLEHWKQAFPGLAIVAHRLDIPRDCRESVTQVLDGYGPFAFNTNGGVFEETGRPLTRDEWDHDVALDYLRGRKSPEEEEHSNGTAEYSEEAIRAKEKDKKILALYTPGHSFGSVSYIFPETKFCCSGYTIPVEDTRDEENPGMGSTGPVLDCRGYITTSRGGMAKQMASARHLVRTYGDRFQIILPSRGGPLILDGDVDARKEILLDILDQYERIGKIYEQLGITSSRMF